MKNAISPKPLVLDLEFPPVDRGEIGPMGCKARKASNRTRH
jgi:hypothetical protein